MCYFYWKFLSRRILPFTYRYRVNHKMTDQILIPDLHDTFEYSVTKTGVKEVMNERVCTVPSVLVSNCRRNFSTPTIRNEN